MPHALIRIGFVLMMGDFANMSKDISISVLEMNNIPEETILQEDFATKVGIHFIHEFLLEISSAS